MEGLRRVLTSIICAKSLDVVSNGIFHEMYKMAKFGQNLAFVRDKIDP